MSKHYEHLYEKQELDKLMLDFMKVDGTILPPPPPLDPVGAPTPAPTPDAFLDRVKSAPTTRSERVRAFDKETK
jgi:hypothetical protein